MDAALEVSVPPSRPIKFCGSPERFDQAVVSSSVVIFSSLEKAPLACEFSPRTFNANAVFAANPEYVY